MNFNLKRLYYGISGRKNLIFLVLIIPVFYLAASALIPDRFLIKKKIYISDNAPIASFVNPFGFKTFGELRKTPKEFFLNKFNMNASIRLAQAAFENEYSVNTLKKVVTQCGFYSPGKDSIQMIYEGRDLKPGKVILQYYSERLIVKAREGLTRSNSGKGAPVASLSESLEIKKIRALWRTERLTPLMVSIAISIFLFFLLIIFIEWTDPSFKSERQIARYTGLPVIGAIPDLNAVSGVINRNTDPAEISLHNQFLPTS